MFQRHFLFSHLRKILYNLILKTINIKCNLNFNLLHFELVILEKHFKTEINWIRLNQTRLTMPIYSVYTIGPILPLICLVFHMLVRIFFTLKKFETITLQYAIVFISEYINLICFFYLLRLFGSKL